MTLQNDPLVDTSPTPNIVQRSGLAILLTGGIVLSYLPQMLIIVTRKSSFGLSPTFLMFGSIGTTANLCNIILLGSMRFAHCPWNDRFGRCLLDNIGLVQISLQWLCFSAIFILFYVYYEDHLKYSTCNAMSLLQGNEEGRDQEVDEEEEGVHEDGNGFIGLRDEEFEFPLSPWATQRRTSKAWKIAQAIGMGTISFWILALSASIITLFLTPEHESSSSKGFSESLAIGFTFLSSVSGLVQYLPQILLTLSKRIVGSLSMHTMMVQVPGSFLFAYSLYIIPGMHWSSWVTFIVSGVLQGVLLLICFWVQQQRDKRVFV